MYSLPVVVLLVSNYLDFAGAYSFGPNSYLLSNQIRLATERLDGKNVPAAIYDQSIVLNFDDIPTTDGQAPIGLYNDLLFEGLKVVNISDSSLLDDEDHDCAVSHPNTLISSSYPDDGKIPHFKISNSSLVFDLLSISIKPRLKRSSDYTLIRYKFWQVRNGKTVATSLVQVLHGVGHHAVTTVEFEKYGYTIENLKAIELAVIEEGKTDYALCLDDLGVRVRKLTDSEGSK